MAAAQKKSKKQSGGKRSARQRLRDSYVFFLDENLSKCQPIIEVLTTAGLSFELHYLHFQPGEDDPVWLDAVGKKGWIVLTKDKAQRYTPLEKSQIERHKIRQFSFSSGNLSALEMAEILRVNIRRMLKFLEKHDPPFIASLNNSGVYQRFPAASDSN